MIPAGSKVTLTITEIHESENKGDKTGKLTLTPTAVEIAGRELRPRRLGRRRSTARCATARPTRVTWPRSARAPRSAPSLGRVIGGSTKGAVIGGVIGGAVGTQRAIETQDRDVVVPASSRVEITLGGTFTR